MKRSGSRFLNLLVAILFVLPSVLPVGAFAVQAAPAPRIAILGTRSVPATAASVPATETFVPGRVIVKMRAGRSATKLAGSHGVTASSVAVARNVTTVKVPEGVTATQLVSELAQDPNVEFASPDYIRQATAYTSTPNDPAYNDASTWTLTSSVNYAFGKSWWQRTSGANMAPLWGALGASVYGPRASGADIKVAVLDTGFYLNHPDRGANIVGVKDEFESYTGSTNRYVTDSDVTPAPVTAPLNNEMTASHGTAVAGEIAAASNNGIGVTGISYDTTVLVYKVGGIWTDGSPANNYPAGCFVILDSAIIQGIRDATDAGAKIISMSLGGPSYSQAMQDAIDYAYSHGVLVVAASGNGGANNGVNYPGANEHVIAVGSYELDINHAKMRSSFTDYGVGVDATHAGAHNGQLDVLAPGAGVWGLCDPTYNTGQAGYTWWSGTSMATPAFAGMAALMWRFAPNLTADDITSYMLSTSDAAGSGQPNTAYGWGYVDPNAAYAKLKTDLAYLASPRVTAPAFTSVSTVPVSWSTVSGRGVSYDVSVDGNVSISGTTATSASLTLANGAHTVAVTPRSSYNWTNGAAATVTITVDTTVPTISGLSFDAGTGLISWTHSDIGATYTTRYRVDNGTVGTLTGMSYDPNTDGVTDGTHTFSVQVTDEVGNSSAWSTISFDFLTPPATPAITSGANSPIAGYALAWSAVAGATGYEVSLNSATASSVTSLGTGLSLAPGANSVAVRAVKSNGSSILYSTWATKTVTYAVPLPASPVVAAPFGTTVPAVTVSWNAVDYATSYEYRLDSGIVVSVGPSMSVLVTLSKGDNLIEVRSRDSAGTSAWSAATVVFTPPVPSSPIVVLASVVATDNLVDLGWASVPGAVSYDYQVNSGSIVTTTATSVEVTSMVRGLNALRVRSRSVYGDTSQWASATVDYQPAHAYGVGTPTVTAIVYGGTATLRALVQDNGGTVLGAVPVTIEQSYDRVNWTPLPDGATDAAGSLSYSLKPSRTTYYRVTCGGDSRVVRAGVKPYLTTPWAPAKHDHHAFSVWGYLKARHTAGKVNVKITAYLRNPHTGHYDLKKTVSVKNYNYSSYTKYSGSISLPYNGTWRLYATYAATSVFDARTSGYRTVTVK